MLYRYRLRFVCKFRDMQMHRDGTREVGESSISALCTYVLYFWHRAGNCRHITTEISADCMTYFFLMLSKWPGYRIYTQKLFRFQMFSRVKDSLSLEQLKRLSNEHTHRNNSRVTDITKEGNPFFTSTDFKYLYCKQHQSIVYLPWYDPSYR